MVEVRLHGALAREFGRVWNLEVQSPAEAVQAIDTMKKGFRAAIMKLDQAGMVFRVRSKTHDYGDDDVEMLLGDTKRIDIIPIVRGASAGLRFVAGAVLFVVGAATSWLGGAGLPVAGLGLSLMFGAVTEWLTPKIKREDVEKSLNSWSFNGPVNTTEQGAPVPIIYGEVLTGGVPISAGIVTSSVTPDGATEPSVSIGGNPEFYVRAYGPGVYTIVVSLSASPFNLQDPLTYSWGYTGFASAVAKRLVISNRSTMRLELDYNITSSAVLDSGSVNVTVNGVTYGSGSGPVADDASTSLPVTVYVAYENLPAGGGA